MKMKLFTAGSLDEALARMRSELGPDAVVLSSHEENGIVEVRAAVERIGPRTLSFPRLAEPRPVLNAPAPQPAPRQTAEPVAGGAADILRWGGAPESFIRFVTEGGAKLAGADPLAALTASLEGFASFAPIQPRPERSILLVGGPGAGRSTAAAKLSLRLSDLDAPLEAVAADFDATGASVRLAALMRRPTILAALSPDGLVRMLDEKSAQARRFVIDAPPINPLDAGDLARIGALIERTGVEPVAVISAEGHPADIEDAARALAALGARRAIVTKLDVVRRRAGVIAALSSARLSIAQLGLTMSVGGGLTPATASRIARLLLDPAPEAELLRGAA